MFFKRRYLFFYLLPLLFLFFFLSIPTKSKAATFFTNAVNGTSSASEGSAGIKITALSGQTTATIPSGTLVTISAWEQWQECQSDVNFIFSSSSNPATAFTDGALNGNYYYTTSKQFGSYVTTGTSAVTKEVTIPSTIPTGTYIYNSLELSCDSSRLVKMLGSGTNNSSTQI